MSQAAHVEPQSAPLNGKVTTEAIVPAASHADEPSRALSAFSSVGAFEAAQRMAKALSVSTLVPKEYQNNIPNVLIAMELANRIGASVFQVMQNLDVIHGRPSWRAQFLIATVNASGRFTPLRFRYVGKEGSSEWGCRAFAKDRETGEECVGALITLGMAKEEGWSTKSGSKWKTMPEQMLMYRAAAFWARVYAPELSLGMQTREEVIDTTGVEIAAADLPQGLKPGNTQALEDDLLGKPSLPADEDPGTHPGDREPGED